MRKCLLVVAAIMLLGLAGCSNLSNVTKSIETAESESKTNRQIASEYIENKLKIDEVCNARAAKNDDYPSFLNNIDIVDKEGNKILFADFTEEEKQVFYSIWKEALLNSLVEKLDADDGFVEMLLFENEVFNMTEDNRSLLNTSPELFLKNYQKNLKKLLKKKNARASSVAASSKDITANCNVTSSVNTCKKWYKKGRLFICTDSSSSIGTDYIGHISIAKDDRWQNNWDYNSLARATITSYPRDVGSMWPGKTDGVQLEPIGLWVGNSGGSARQVSMYDVGCNHWVWNWFNSHYEYRYATDAERSDAVNYATYQIGKPYNWVLVMQWLDNAFYCSSLCNLAWNHANSNYCFSVGLWVTPSDIAASDHTRLACSYTNY